MLSRPTNRFRLSLVAAATVSMGLTGLVPTHANVASVAQSSVVSADPVDTTPHVKDGKVLSILPMGDRVFVGGTFTQVRNDAGAGNGTECPGDVVTRKGLFAMKKNAGGHWCIDTGFIFNIEGVTQGSTDPATGDEVGENRGVQSIVAGEDEHSIYVGGDWTGGGNKLIKINVDSSTQDTGFKSGITSAVKDVVRSGSRLFVAGKFKYVLVSGSQVPRFGLASLDAGDGALRDDLDIAFTDPRQGTEARVEGLAISPDGKTLVTGGNFKKVDGQERWQVALLDVTSGQDASLINWQTDRYNDTKVPADATDPLACAEKFDTHIKDLDISPDGTYFVVVTTGGYTSRGPLCDAAARWELGSRGTGLQPTWADYDGGDSFTGVTISGAAVYASGHMRWMNNFHNEGSSTDAVAGPGSVVREGIVALDPVSGLPLAWAPNRERGHGAEALVATPEGLWVGSDTDFIGNRDFDGTPRQGEYHQKLAFFPLQGGFVAATHSTQQLPADLYSVGAAGISLRYLDSTKVGASTTIGSGIDWSKTKGAFTIDNRLYTGRSDGKLLAYTFNGTQLGNAEEVPLRGLSSTDFPVSQMGGMFYDKGRIYFTKKGTNKLYYRSFMPGATVADDIVGDLSIDAPSTTKVDWTKVEGMTMAGGELFWAEGNTLKAATFADGKVTGNARNVGTSTNLAGNGLFLRPVTTTPPASIDPPVIDPPANPPVTPNGVKRDGYWMVGSDGRVYPFGDAGSFGEAAPYLGGVQAVDLEPSPTFNGYWIVDEQGRVFAFGDAKSGLGNVDRARLLPGEKVTSLSATPSGNGYWIFTTKGRALTFGDAAFLGDVSNLKLNGAVLDSIPTPSGKGYYMVAADGGIFAFGDAAFHGSMGNTKLNAPVQSLVPDSDGVGYWLVASDGGIFAFKANFRGSMGDRKLNKPVTGMVRYHDGYLMVGEDGGIFNFSTAPFKGSLGNNPPAKPIVSVAAVND